MHINLLATSHAGRHCCLYCEITADQMKHPLHERGPAPVRTLSTLQRDYLQFCTQGKGNLKNAKNFNNVIGQPFFDIPLTQVYTQHQSDIHVINIYNVHVSTYTKVALPGLHISLGIFMKLWTLMERECHELYLKLAQHTTGKAGDRAGFLTYSAIVHEIKQLEEERDRNRRILLVH